MKAKKLIAVLLALVMAAALLPLGAMAQEVSPLDAAELHTDRMSALSEDASAEKVSTLGNGLNGFYISVNGQAFTDYNQTIKCGNGTAKLTRGENYPVLTLTNATISKAEHVISADGVAYYAGITHFSDYGTLLVIKIVGDCSMTAPAASTSSKVYEGIVTDGYLDIKGGKLKMNNYSIGIDADRANFIGAAVNMSSKIGVYANYVSVSDSSISVTGRSAILATELSCYDNKSSVTLNADSKGEEKIAVYCETLNMDYDATLNVSVNANTKSFADSDGYVINAVYASGMSGGSVNTRMNITDTGKAFVLGVYSEDVCMNEVSSDIKINGTTKMTVGIEYDNTDSPTSLRSISSVIKGASDNDVPLALGERFDNKGDATHIYASTDAKNPVFGAIVLSEIPHDMNHDTDSALQINGRILCPQNGDYSLTEQDGEKICIVVDGEGKPANSVVITNEDHPFKDVKTTDYFKDPVVWAYENEITKGTSDISFSPNADCTRAQVVTFLWRAMGCPEVGDVKNPFNDVKDGQWYTEAVLWAVENGITNGTSANTFSPNAKVTRAQVVTFLYRTAKAAPVKTDNPFNDVKAGQWYTDAVLWTVENGITNGTSKTTFSPNSVCTRGQIVTFLYRFNNVK